MQPDDAQRTSHLIEGCAEQTVTVGRLCGALTSIIERLCDGEAPLGPLPPARWAALLSQIETIHAGVEPTLHGLIVLVTSGWPWRQIPPVPVVGPDADVALERWLLAALSDLRCTSATVVELCDLIEAGEDVAAHITDPARLRTVCDTILAGVQDCNDWLHQRLEAQGRLVPGSEQVQ